MKRAKPTVLAATTKRTTQCSSATYAWTRPKMPLSVCAATCSAGHACINGWRRARRDSCVPYARRQSAKRRSFHCTVAAARINRIRERKCRLGQPVSASNRNHSPDFRDSVSAIPVLACRSASAHFRSAFSHRHSTLANSERRSVARPSLKTNNLCQSYSYGWPCCSCPG